MKKRKLKLKKKVKLILVLTLVFIISACIITNKIKTYLYHQTYEYKFLELNYTLKDIDLLNKNLSNKELDLLLTKEKDTTLLSLLKCEYFKKENLDRYYKYIEDKSVNAKDAINMVNINRDYDFYGTILKTNTKEKYQMIVNKYYLLTKDYNPENLVKIPTKYAWGDDNYIIKDVYEAFLDMWKAASKEGYYLMVNSAYRTYEYQEQLYNDYKENYGLKYAENYAARPGASEHQTGMALDIFEKDHTSSKTFKDTEVYTWLKDNSYKYGFILRYPEGKENITGYSFESWHYRYVGIDTAKEIYQKNITFDEYYGNKKN